MPALFMTPGPIDLFAAFRGDGGQGGLTTVYIGTCEESPEVEVRPAYVDVRNDVGGSQLPTQKVYEGEQHLIYLNAVNRFDWAGYKTMSRATVPGGTGPGISIDGALNRGSLTLGGAFDFEFVLRSSFGGTAVAPAQMPVGRRYYSTILVAARETKRGSRVHSVSMILEANGLFNPTARSFSLYSEVASDVLAGLPSVN